MIIQKEKLLPFCCVNYVLTFCCITYKNPASNIKSKTAKIWYEYICIFKYFPIQIFVRIIFISFFLYEYIRIFICIIFYMNIFRYSFALFFIWIYSDIRSYQKFIFVTPCFTLLLSFSKFHFHNLTFIISLSQFNFHNLTFTI